MRFFEYEAREIVKRAGIPVTDYGFATDAEAAREIAQRIGGPVVIKSQVLSGGRMKAGGVKFADTPEEAEQHAREILALEIGGHMPRGVLVDPKAEVEQEYYAGVVWDGTRKRPVMIFSPVGGIDIEQVAAEQPEKVGRRHLSTILPRSDYQAKEVIAATGVSGRDLARLTPIVRRLADVFAEKDMTLAEINPLGRLADGSFVALDAHMEMENEARPRHGRCSPSSESASTRRVRRASRRRSRSPARKSTPATIAASPATSPSSTATSGSSSARAAGRSRSSTPCARTAASRRTTARSAATRRSPRRPGSPSSCSRSPACERIAVMMSIVSNTRVDIVARGVIKACLELGHDPAEKIAFFRIPGAWEEEGFKILDKYGIEYADRSVSLNEAARRAVEKIQGAPAGAWLASSAAEVGA